MRLVDEQSLDTPCYDSRHMARYLRRQEVFFVSVGSGVYADFCAAGHGEALARCGVPDIFHSDQGCQFTSYELPGF